MSNILRHNPLAVILAVLMHVVIIAFLLVGVDWREKPRPMTSTVEIVKARVVDESRLQAEIKKLKDAKKKKIDKQTAARKKEEKRLADLKKRRIKEKKKLADLEKKRKKEEKQQAKKRAEAKKKAATEKKKLAELKKKRDQIKKEQETEKKKLAEMKQARDLAEKVRKAKAQAAADRRKAEAEKKRKAEIAQAKADKEARQRELEAQMQAEQDATELDAIISQIRAKVTRNWLRPPGTAELGLKCSVRVRLGTSGSVLLVQVIKSSGDGAFDRSVEAAVRKADPLPMPGSPRLLAEFRDIKFDFDPGK